MKQIIILILFITGFIYLIEDQCRRMEQYEIENNCKYDTNDLCYTYEERPWLFDKNYTEDLEVKNARIDIL